MPIYDSATAAVVCWVSRELVGVEASGCGLSHQLQTPGRTGRDGERSRESVPAAPIAGILSGKEKPINRPRVFRRTRWKN